MSDSGVNEPIIFDHVKGEIRRGSITTTPSYVVLELRAEIQRCHDAMELASAELTGVEGADLDEYERACLLAAIGALAPPESK